MNRAWHNDINAIALNCLQFSRVNNSHLALGFTRVGTYSLDSFDEIDTFQNLAKDDMATIQPGGLNR
jgi:hypothetical protein